MSEKKISHFFSVAIDKILFKLACNDDIHNILNLFKFQLDNVSLTVELAALEHLKSPYKFINKINGSQVSDRCPLGYLFHI